MAAMASSWALSKDVSSWSKEDDPEEELERSPFLIGRAFMSEGFIGNSPMSPVAVRLGKSYVSPALACLACSEAQMVHFHDGRLSLSLSQWMSKLSASEDACLRAVTNPAFVRAAVWSFVSSSCNCMAEETESL